MAESRHLYEQTQNSKKPVERDLFLSVLLLVFGLTYAGGGLFLAGESYRSVFESDSVWISITIGILSLVILTKGLVLIAASLFPRHGHLQTVVEKLDGTQGSYEIGCMLVLLAIPVYWITKFLRGLASSNKDS